MELAAPICVRIGLFLSLPTLLISGIRSWRRSEGRHRGAGLTALGAGLALLTIVGPLLMYSYFHRRLAHLQAESDRQLAQLRNTLDRSDLPPERLALVWKAYASSVYLRDGEAVELVTANGTKSVYEPTEVDKGIRESTLELRARLRPPYGHAIWWAVVSFACALLGALTPIRDRVIAEQGG